MRIVNAAPLAPTMTMGSQMCASMSANLAMLHGASSNSGENSPPVLMPNQVKPTCMKISARRNGGVARPTRASVVMR